LPEALVSADMAARLEIVRASVAHDNPELRAVGLDEPRIGATAAGYSFAIAGHVVPVRGAPARIKLHEAQRSLPRVPVTGNAFAARLNAVQLPRRFELPLTLILEDGTRTPLGKIEGRRAALPAYPVAAHRPLLVTTLGRSGSTWLTWLLGQHPEIADYRSFEYESKATAYFAGLLQALTQPSSYYQSLRGEVGESGWWRGDAGRPLWWYSSHDSIDEWLETEYVEDLIAFFAGRIDALHRRLAEAIGKPHAAYVVEKLQPTFFGQRIVREILPETREIFLVRDLRDIAASIFAFGEKRGRKWYDQHAHYSDERIVRESLRDEVDAMLESWGERGSESLLVRYEDLVTAPERTLAEVLTELGLDSRRETVLRMLDAAARVDLERRSAHVTSPTAERSIGRWRSDLAPALQRACEEALGEGLETFGYA
jgi:hypothetical protein